MPWTANDCRHLPTVIGGIFSAAAICWLFDPSAAAKTMRLRRANDCGAEEERTSLSGHRPTVPEVHYTIKNYPYDVLVRAFSIYVYTFHAIMLPAGRGEAQVQAYSQDLRERVLRALDRGDRPTEIARRFEVSRIGVYQVRGREQETGVRTSLPIGGH